MHLTEDKSYWCQAYGPVIEREFAASLAQHGVSAGLNPAKEHDPYTHDLTACFPSDLKTVRTPLFTAQKYYSLDPQYAVTFNRKDMRRYMELYPNIIVFFDVHWQDCHATLGAQTHRVNDMRLVAAGFLSDIQRAIIEDGRCLHTYQRRVNDQSGNAKQSWVFDVRRLHTLSYSEFHLS